MSWNTNLKINNLIQQINTVAITANNANTTANNANTTANSANTKATNLATGLGLIPIQDPLHAGTNSLYLGNWVGNKNIGVYYVNSSFTRWGQNIGNATTTVAVTWYNASSDGLPSMNGSNTGGSVPYLTFRLFSLFNATIGEQSGDAISYKTMPNGTKTGLMFPSNGSYLIECVFEISTQTTTYGLYITKNYTFDGINDFTNLSNNASTYVNGYSRNVNRISTVVNITASNTDYVCIAMYNNTSSITSIVGNGNSLITITRL